MTLIHERDSDGDDFYRFGAKTSSSGPDNEANSSKQKAKDQGTHYADKDAKKTKEDQEQKTKK
jgi:hypothetical protein